MTEKNLNLTVSTSRFGEISYEMEMVFMSPKGIPGFEKMRRWLLIGDDDSTIKHLQSLEDGRIALPVAVPLQLFPDYSVEIPREYLCEVEAVDERDLGVLVVLTVPPKAAWDMTVNLRAPILIGLSSRIMIQIILPDESLSLRHPLWDLSQRDEMRQRLVSSKNEG